MKIRLNGSAIAALITPILFVLLSPQAYAGAWVLERGKSYTKVGVSDYSASDFFGDNADLGEFEGTSISYYGEWGLGNNLGLFTSILYQDIRQTDSAGVAVRNDGLGDLDIGVKYQWQAEPFVLSTQFLAKFPYLYDDDDALPLGNGQEDFEAKVLIGKSLGALGYFGLELGYRFRTDDPSDEIRYLACRLQTTFTFDPNSMASKVLTMPMCNLPVAATCLVHPSSM